MPSPKDRIIELGVQIGYLWITVNYLGLPRRIKSLNENLQRISSILGALLISTGFPKSEKAFYHIRMLY